MTNTHRTTTPNGETNGGATGASLPRETDTTGATDTDRSLGDDIEASLEQGKQYAKAKAEAVRDRAEEGMSRLADETKEATAEHLSDFATAIRSAGDALRGKDHSPAANLLSSAASGVEEFARSIDHKSPDQLIEVVRDFGRKNPAAFIAGSVLIGFALGRFGRSSRQSNSSTAQHHSAHPGSDYRRYE